jgi:hypothetical protein
MPLEGLYSLLSDTKQDKAEPLIGLDRNGNRYLQIVTKEYFQTNPNKIAPNAVTDDVLGFCSLVLSYAKAAREMQPNASPKIDITIMPRTDFNTMFKQVSKKLGGDLFQLFDVLACYKSTWDRTKKKYTVRYGLLVPRCVSISILANDPKYRLGILYRHTEESQEQCKTRG